MVMAQDAVGMATSRQCSGRMSRLGRQQVRDRCSCAADYSPATTAAVPLRVLSSWPCGPVRTTFRNERGKRQ
jgi:hypothetical protein